MSFKYFGYGSNMLTDRMRINCPTATASSIAMLKDFKLTFQGHSEFWKGDGANIQRSPGYYVWGVVWDVSKDNEAALMEQEHEFDFIEVTVITPDGLKLRCKTFQKRDSFKDGLPSASYKKVIIKGAMEHNIPEDYCQFLKRFQDNGYDGEVGVPTSIYS